MADDVKLLAVIDANTKAFENALKRIQTQTNKTFSNADRSVNRLNASLNASTAAATRLGRNIGIAFTAIAIASVSRFIRAFIQNTIEAESAVAQLNAVLRSTGGAVGLSSQELQDLAASLQTVTTFGDEAIIGAEALLLTFTKIGGNVLPQATATVLDMSTALGTDLKTSAIQVGKALQDPVKGITALRRVGVNFSESQKTIIKNLVETGRLAEAQGIILKELQTEFGGSARAARDTLGGALKALSEAWGELFEVSGPASNQLRIAIEDLVTAISDPKFKEAVATIGVSLIGALESFANILPRLSSPMSDFSRDVATMTAQVHNLSQAFLDNVETLGRRTGIVQLSEAIGVTDFSLKQIDKAHDAILRQAEDTELLAALQKKFTIAPTETPTAGGGARGGGLIDPDIVDEETAALEAEAAAIAAAKDEAEEAERQRKKTADQIVRQKEAILELISDLEFENSLIGLSNEERAVENELRRAGAEATQEQRAQIEELVRAGLSEQQALDDLIARMDAVRDAAGTALSTFNDALRDGESIADALTAALDRVLDAIIGIAEQAFIENLLGKAGTATGGGGFLANLFRNFGGSFASGGILGAGRWGIAGERGPEFIRGPASITPMGAGGGVEVHIHNAQQPVLEQRESTNGRGERRLDIVFDEMLASGLGGPRTRRAGQGMFGMQPRLTRA